MSEERELMKKRGSFKGRLTTFINYLDALNIKTLNESDATEIQLRLGKIESLYEQYDEEENLPPLKWKLGRSVAVHPGTDGLVRVADIQTSTGVLRRAFNRICPLPIMSSG
ncbi:unnamed protein product [Euphydryas editha]|uniref:DUF5641 domain-containing protein n=1 Tax=Euphydryas editha TaxID=104508 RepID=A0AAU9TF78_EUPED|nr:unnamed protein product [Euphydryas editha]